VGLILAFGVLAKFDFSIGNVMAAAIAKHPLGPKILGPISLSSPGAAISAFLTQAVGLAGLPHLIMRFFTVPNVVEARRSANFATALIGLFYIIMIVIGFGAIAILTNNPDYAGPNGGLRNGVNMAPLYLAHSIGGDLLLGICAAALFATILAVVAGLTLAVAAAVSHDLYAGVIKKGTQTEAQEMKVSRIAAVAFSVVSILMSVAFRHENITFLVVTALSIAASSTFPVLFLAIFWRGLTAAGAVIGGSIGLVGALTAIVLGPTVWVPVLGNAAPIFPYQYPTVVTLPLAMVLIVVISLLSQKSATAPAPARS
jgi:cation/acetate symporter